MRSTAASAAASDSGISIYHEAQVENSNLVVSKIFFLRMKIQANFNSISCDSASPHHHRHHPPPQPMHLSTISTSSAVAGN